jgi:catechol 2,3-dioxygenase-like lactoylglutathione lyase family enzyme
MSQATTSIRQVGRVMVPVSDQDAAIAFYTEKLGFELRADIPFGDGDRWVEVGPAGGPTNIALVTPRNEFQPGTNTNIALDTDDARAAQSGLREAGVDVDDEIMGDGNPVPPMFWIRDQDGNVLLIVESQQS